MDAELPSRVRSELLDLANTCDETRKQHPNYCPVGDICNQLFFVEPPPSISLPAKIRSLVDKKCRFINDSLLNIDRDQLRAIENILLVAGTPQKAAAIRFLLDHRGYHIRFLCTDEDAAKAILDNQ